MHLIQDGSDSFPEEEGQRGGHILPFKGSTWKEHGPLSLISHWPELVHGCLSFRGGWETYPGFMLGHHVSKQNFYYCG